MGIFHGFSGTILESGNFDVLSIFTTALRRMDLPLFESDKADLKGVGDTWADRVLAAVGEDTGILVTLGHFFHGEGSPDEARRPQIARVQNARAILDGVSGDDHEFIEALISLCKECNSLATTLSPDTQNDIRSEVYDTYSDLDCFTNPTGSGPSLITSAPRSTILDQAKENLGISGDKIADTGKKVADEAGKLYDKAKDVVNNVANKAGNALDVAETVIYVALGLGIVIVGVLLYAIVRNPGRVTESAKAATAVKGVFK